MNDWRPVPGHERTHEVNSIGEVRSVYKLTPTITHGTGYSAVTLGHQTRANIHTLVARAFIGPQPPGTHVNHKDGVKTNNRVENLEYVTPQGNQHHAFLLGNRKHYFTEKQMDRISQWFFVDGDSVMGIARRLVGKPYE